MAHILLNVCQISVITLNKIDPSVSFHYSIPFTVPFEENRILHVENLSVAYMCE